MAKLSSGSARRVVLIEAATIVGLTAASILVRWPFLQSMPLFTDESVGNLRALAMVHGGGLYLTNWAPYLGALYSYLAAGVFLVFGHSWETPRLIVMVIGSATPPLVYVLARSLLNRWQAILAAGLMVTSPWHIVLDSHIAWGNSTTPFFATLTMIAFAWSLRKRYPPGLVAAGFLFGLTIQTHIVSAVMGLGFVIVLLGRPYRSWFRQKWLYLAVVALIVAYSNMLAFNLVGTAGKLPHSDFTVASASNSADVLEVKYDISIANVFRRRSLLETWEVARAFIVILGGSDNFGSGSGPIGPAAFLYGAFVIYGAVAIGRRGKWLPIAVVVPTGVVAWLFMAVSENGTMYPRYITFVLPLFYISIAVALTDLGHLLGRLHHPHAAMVALGLLLALYPLVPVGQYYDAKLEDGKTNDGAIALLKKLEASESAYPNPPVLIHSSLGVYYRKDAPYYSLAGVLKYVLSMDGVPSKIVRILPGTVEANVESTEHKTVLVVGPPGILGDLPPTLEPRFLFHADARVRWSTEGSTPVDVVLVTQSQQEHPTGSASSGPP